MAFRPFGFAFAMKTPLDLVESKRRIRECKLVWYSPDNGPRGFILRRFICLWNSLFQSNGPMLIGWMRQDHAGCSISGRAGSDLNGILFLTLCGLMMPILAFLAFQDGIRDLSFFVVVILTVFAFGLLLLLASNDRREAVPLVDFLELATGGGARHEYS